jgi:transposase
MRYQLTDHEWSMLPSKPRGIPRANDRSVPNGIFTLALKGSQTAKRP